MFGEKFENFLTNGSNGVCAYLFIFLHNTRPVFHCRPYRVMHQVAKVIWFDLYAGNIQHSRLIMLINITNNVNVMHLL